MTPDKATDAELYLATLKRLGFRARPTTMLFRLIDREYALTVVEGRTYVNIGNGDGCLSWFRFRNEDGAFDGHGSN